MQPARLREALLEQLAHLIDEVEALKGVVELVPDALLEARPPGQTLSIKETYGLLAALDEAVYLPRLRQLMAEDEPAFEVVDEDALAAQTDWNALPLAAILAQVQAARRALLDYLSALPADAWTRTARLSDDHPDVYRLVHHRIQHDADLLRTVGYRLYESTLFRK